MDDSGAWRPPKVDVQPSTPPGTLPVGSIIMWRGAVASVPVGWRICDGTGGTLDMRGCVPVGVDAAQAEFDTLGETGGTKTHALITAEMPSHGHTQNAHNHTQNAHNHVVTPSGLLTNAVPVGGAIIAATQSNDSTSATAVNQAATAVNQTTGSGTAHNNLQPYRAVHFIERIS